MRCGFGVVVALGLVACGDKPAEDDADTGAETGGSGGADDVAAAVCDWTPPFQVGLDLTGVRPMGDGFVGLRYTGDTRSLVRLGATGAVEAELDLGAGVSQLPGAAALSVQGDRVLLARVSRDERTGESATHLDVDLLDADLQAVASATLLEMDRNSIQYVQLQAGPSADGWWVAWSMQRISTLDGLDGAVFALDGTLGVVDTQELDIGTATSAGPGGPFLQTVHPRYLPDDAPEVDDYAVRARSVDTAGLPTGEWTDLGDGHAHPTATVPAGSGALALTTADNRLGSGDATLWLLGADGAAIATEALGSTMLGEMPLAPLAGGALLSWWDFNGEEPVPHIDAVGADGARVELEGFPIGVDGQLFFEAPSVATSDAAIVLWWHGEEDETWLMRCER